MSWNEAGKEDWTNRFNPPYICVYESIGGWKPQLLVWVKYRQGGQYEPWQTGSGWATKEMAESEGKDWAVAEGIEFK